MPKLSKRRSSKQPPKEGRGAKRKRPAGEEAEETRNEFFADSDAEAGGSDAEVAEADVQENAAEKRLRLAKGYLQQMKLLQQQEGGAADEEDGEGAHDALGQRLKQNAMEAAGYVQRHIAGSLRLPKLLPVSQYNSSRAGRLFKCHRLPVTALALSSDDAVAFSVSKDGSICRLDVETEHRSMLPPPTGNVSQAEASAGRAEWVAPKARSVSDRSFLTAALSSDSRYLALGGADHKIYIWDTRSQSYVKALTGRNSHRDIITGLAFRENTHELFTCSFDRTVKLWSLDEMAYVDTLFGHQAEVLSIDVGRQERAVTTGQDHTCRVWKVPEESQLVFRSHGMALDCCKYITGTEWVTGASDGSLAVWSQTKKRPTSVLRRAHAFPVPGPLPGPSHANGGAANGTAAPADAGAIQAAAAAPQQNPLGAGSVGGDTVGWVSAVASCKGTDLVASGAGDGVIRLWQVAEGKHGKTLEPLGGLPARGFTNALQIARSGRFLLAGMGQEPRLGRWARDRTAKNGILLHRLEIDDSNTMNGTH